MVKPGCEPGPTSFQSWTGVWTTGSYRSTCGTLTVVLVPACPETPSSDHQYVLQLSLWSDAGADQGKCPPRISQAS